ALGGLVGGGVKRTTRPKPRTPRSGICATRRQRSWLGREAISRSKPASCSSSRPPSRAWASFASGPVSPFVAERIDNPSSVPRPIGAGSYSADLLPEPPIPDSAHARRFRSLLRCRDGPVLHAQAVEEEEVDIRRLLIALRERGLDPMPSVGAHPHVDGVG